MNKRIPPGASFEAGPRHVPDKKKDYDPYKMDAAPRVKQPEHIVGLKLEFIKAELKKHLEQRLSGKDLDKAVDQALQTLSDQEINSLPTEEMNSNEKLQELATSLVERVRTDEQIEADASEIEQILMEVGEQVIERKLEQEGSLEDMIAQLEKGIEVANDMINALDGDSPASQAVILHQQKQLALLTNQLSAANRVAAKRKATSAIDNA